ncbi:hypothetical protein [Namhaeicola litoreus]|uniref:Uncharacterized protein n=1 Tax=Namhaeicola litoreus TaxID=1052145 RepID=A0ABW3Y2B2_9FLAO
MESILIASFMLFIVFVPYYLFLKNGSNIKNKVNKLIENEISQTGLHFSEKETWSHNFIGIDQDAKKMLFVRVIDDKSECTLIDLTKVKNVRIDKKVVIDKENKNSSSLEKLDLAVSLYPSGETILHLFDTDIFYKEEYELNRAEAWVKKINTFKNLVNTNQKAA